MRFGLHNPCHDYSNHSGRAKPVYIGTVSLIVASDSAALLIGPRLFLSPTSAVGRRRSEKQVRLLRVATSPLKTKPNYGRKCRSGKPWVSRRFLTVLCSIRLREIRKDFKKYPNHTVNGLYRSKTNMDRLANLFLRMIITLLALCLCCRWLRPKLRPRVPRKSRWSVRNPKRWPPAHPHLMKRVTLTMRRILTRSRCLEVERILRHYHRLAVLMPGRLQHLHLQTLQALA